MSNDQESCETDGGHFVVFVDDNFHYMNEDERYKAGVFASYEDALAEAKRIVDEDLAYNMKPGMTADALYEQYIQFGEDPFIIPAGKDDGFSAWDYAKTQCLKVCTS
jgi:hypothetical protein